MPKTQVEVEASRLDESDRLILRALSVDPGLTNKALAGRLGLAESTCAYRVRSLRRRGVIAGTSLRVDLAALGYPLQAVINVRLGSHDKAHVNRLHAEFLNAPGVIQVFHMAGESDFLLHVATATPEALRDFVLDHVTVHPVVRQTETQLVFDSRPGPGVLGQPAVKNP